MIATSCPKCGVKASKITLLKLGGRSYVYAYHYSKKDKKLHKWHLGPLHDSNTVKFIMENKLAVLDSIIEINNSSNNFTQLCELLGINKEDVSLVDRLVVRVYKYPVRSSL